MPALEPVTGVRIVADPQAIDAATWQPSPGTQLWRTAPDEVFATHPDHAPTASIQDAHAIVEAEHGFVAARLSAAEIDAACRHIDFALPAGRPALVQGKIAGVPARLALLPDGSGILLVHAAYAAELRGRLGW